MRHSGVRWRVKKRLMFSNPSHVRIDMAEHALHPHARAHCLPVVVMTGNLSRPDPRVRPTPANERAQGFTEFVPPRTSSACIEHRLRRLYEPPQALRSGREAHHATADLPGQPAGLLAGETVPGKGRGRAPVRRGLVVVKEPTDPRTTDRVRHVHTRSARRPVSLIVQVSHSSPSSSISVPVLTRPRSARAS